MFSRWWGRRRDGPPAPDLSDTLERSKQAIEVLDRRRKHLQAKIAAQEEEAKEKARLGDRRAALFALKRKKLYEKELQQCSDAHLTLENQIITLESAQTQRLAVDALAAGVGAQKAINQQISLQKLDNLMDDMQEQAAVQAEWANALSHNVFADTNEAELLAELDQIQHKQLDEALADAAPVPASRPKPPPTQISDDDQIAKILSSLQ